MTSLIVAGLCTALSLPVSGVMQTPAQAGGAPPATGRISGRVVAADTGKPIRRARVRMVSVKGRQSVVLTDAQGRFEFKDLAAGPYRLDAAAERYLNMTFGGQPYTGLAFASQKAIELRDGQQFDAANFALPRGAALEGRVLDEFGDPAPNITIQLSTLEYAAGRRRLMPAGGARQHVTDDKGHFRVYGLAPGDYYMSALSGGFTEQNEAGGFAPTYYPGTGDAAGAERIRLGNGEQRAGLTMQLIPAAMAQLSGVVVDGDRKPVARANVHLTLSDRQGISDFVMMRGLSAADGTFTFRNVPPGSYTVQGFGRPTSGGGNLGVLEFGWLPVVVDGVDHTNLVLRVAKGPSLRGRIVLEETNGPPIQPQDVQIGVVPIEFDSAPVGGGPPPSKMNADWTFEIGNLSGQRLIRVYPRSQEWMLARITRDAIDITDSPVDLRKDDVTDVEIVLTSRVTAVSGTVTSADGRPAADYAVVLFPEDSSKWTDRSRFLALARPSQDGTFIARALPPETYLAVALPGVGSTEWQDPEFLARLRDRATRFALAAGERKQIALTLKQP